MSVNCDVQSKEVVSDSPGLHLLEKGNGGGEMVGLGKRSQNLDELDNGWRRTPIEQIVGIDSFIN